jgi:hypothetical protein
MIGAVETADHDTCKASPAFLSAHVGSATTGAEAKVNDCVAFSPKTPSSST